MQEVGDWSIGMFRRMNYWRRGGGSDVREETQQQEHRSATTPNKTVMTYTGRDLEQNGVLDVEHRLGTGGMGHVHIARNKEDGTTVAVKVGKEVRLLACGVSTRRR